MRARIRFGVYGLDAKVVDEDLTITKKKWTTVTESQRQELLGLSHKGESYVEFDDEAANEAASEDGEWFIDAADTEDESDGTE